MQVLVQTDNQIDGGERLSRFVESTITESLRRFEPRLTRVEVHLHDDNSSKKAADDDKRCVIEVRPRGLKPISVSDSAPTIQQALTGAIEKAERAMERAIGKLEAR